MHIYYTIVDSSFGRLLVAGTDRGICSVCIGDDDKILEATLLSEYPAASIERDEEVLNEWVHELLRHLAGQQPHLDLPIDIRATAFQWRVWEELRRIPYGETRSYSQIARALGDPNKARAVANACANNPIAIVVPCHRIVREDGNSGGYRWGAERKQHLLEQEQATAPRAEEQNVSVQY
jgi:AraC family transcriptional regulator of adaptative response/methylated-DNA-[protein]-cysteine methyltransferase